MNTELLRQVQDTIRETGKVYMADWAIHDREAPDSEDYCGTIGCIAGWAAMLTHEGWTVGDIQRDITTRAQNDWRKLPAAAATYLDLTPEEANRLYYMGNWPAEFREAYEAAEDSNFPWKRNCALAKVVSDRIDHFIDTEGRE